MRITFDVDLNTFESKLGSFIEALYKQLMKDVKSIAELIRDDIKENIMRGRKVPSGTLADNTPSTIAKKGFNAPMIHTGKLHDSISIKEITDGYEVYIEGKDNNDKAFYNHYDRYMKQVYGRYVGLDVKKKNRKGAIKVPARPVFGIRTAIKKDIATILNKK